MTTERSPVWAELLQLVPIVSLALPFILSGSVDLSRARAGFFVGAGLAVAISGLLVARHYALNPILVGTGLWLVAGALAFGAPIPRLVAWLADVQGFALFVVVLGVALASTWWSAAGYVGCPHDDRRWILRSSLVLLGLTVVAVGWSWVFRHNLRLGGGLPFITLNLVRRALVLRAPRAVVGGVV